MNHDLYLKDGWHHYRAHAEWSCLREINGVQPGLNIGRRQTAILIIHAPSADSALRQVHAAMQKAKELNLDRQVVRPKLLPDEYRVTRLFIPYLDAKNIEYEHTFDVPTTVNPDLRQDNTSPVESATMPFFDEAKGQGALSK